MEQLLTKRDLAKRWQISEDTVDRYRKEGIITPVAGIPAVRFTLQHIMELEGTKPEKFSPLEKRRLEREVQTLKAENDQMRSAIAQILNTTAEVNAFIYRKAYKTEKQEEVR